MSRDLVINGTVCAYKQAALKWETDDAWWVATETITCRYCAAIWIFRDSCITQFSLDHYSKDPEKIMHEVNDLTYIAFCGSNKCRKQLEIELVCPKI